MDFVKRDWRVTILIEGEKEALIISRMLKKKVYVNSDFDDYPVVITMKKKYTYREAGKIARKLSSLYIYNLFYNVSGKKIDSKKITKPYEHAYRKKVWKNTAMLNDIKDFRVIAKVFQDLGINLDEESYNGKILDVELPYNRTYSEAMIIAARLGEGNVYNLIERTGE